MSSQLSAPVLACGMLRARTAWQGLVSQQMMSHVSGHRGRLQAVSARCLYCLVYHCQQPAAAESVVGLAEL